MSDQSAQLLQSRSDHICRREGFYAIINEGFRETAELALWQREMPPEIEQAFRGLDCSQHQDLRVEGDGDLILASAHTHLVRQAWQVKAVTLILSDIAAVVQCGAGRQIRYQLRLEYVTDDACRKFHKDKTDLRLITTYFGRGSQWIDTGAGKFEPAINEMCPFDVGMFLGERADRPGHVFHRSPPIAEAGTARLLMVLDIDRGLEQKGR